MTLDTGVSVDVLETVTLGPWATRKQALAATKNVKAIKKVVRAVDGKWEVRVTRKAKRKREDPTKALWGEGTAFKGHARAIYIRAISGVTKAKQLPVNGLWFPVAPSEYSVSANGLWNQQQLVGSGIASHPIGPPLRTITFRSFFPSEDHRDLRALARLCGGLRRPEDYVAPSAACSFIENLRDIGDIFWLVIGTDVLSDGFKVVEDPDKVNNVVKMPAYIESFSWSEAAGRPGDRLFEISFTEYKPQSLRYRLGTVFMEPIPNVYKPKPNEDLVAISIKFFGTPSKWKMLRDLNGFKEGKKVPKDKKTGKPRPVRLKATSNKPTRPAGRTSS